jgi:hypothetical protein
VPEQLEHVGIRRQLGVEHLDRYLFAELEVMGLPDLTHAAPAEEAP